MLSKTEELSLVKTGDSAVSERGGVYSYPGHL